MFASSVLLAACSSTPGSEQADLSNSGGTQRDAQVESLDASLVVTEGGIDATTADGGDAGTEDGTVPDAARDAPADSPVDAPIDAPVDTGVDTGPLGCTKTLSIPAVAATPTSCALNENVTAAPATMTYPCAGGAASVTFDTQTFTGTVTGDQVSLTNVDTFTYGACSWQSTQTLTGTLSSGQLAYAYSEAVKTGTCTLTCTGTGSASVN